MNELLGANQVPFTNKRVTAWLEARRGVEAKANPKRRFSSCKVLVRP